MKNILSEMKAKEYFCRLNARDAKKTLFAMDQMTGDERMNESKILEVRHLAELYEGIIQGSFARELAKKMATAYSKEHPGVLMTQKEAQLYTDVNYIKLYTALGLWGFDYVITVLRQGKTMITDPKTGIDEARMLQAMRWNEVREDRDASVSNYYHHKRGLELVGFDIGIVELLVSQSYIIANVYEQVTASPVQFKVQTTSVRKMKIHFIEEADIIEAFYQAEQPEEPKGYDKTQLAEGSMLLDLAKKGQLKDSEVILEYYESKVKWDAASKRLTKEFSEEECEVIHNNPDTVKELIKSTW